MRSKRRPRLTSRSRRIFKPWVFSSAGALVSSLCFAGDRLRRNYRLEACATTAGNVSSMPLDWTGVFPAITTPFFQDGSVDHPFLATHTKWMLDAGCHGLVPCGSLGEGATLTFDEKVAVLKTCVEACGDKP